MYKSFIKFLYGQDMMTESQEDLTKGKTYVSQFDFFYGFVGTPENLKDRFSDKFIKDFVNKYGDVHLKKGTKFTYMGKNRKGADQFFINNNKKDVIDFESYDDDTGNFEDKNEFFGI